MELQDILRKRNAALRRFILSKRPIDFKKREFVKSLKKIGYSRSKIDALLVFAMSPIFHKKNLFNADSEVNEHKKL
jgi:hypothetical protein